MLSLWKGAIGRERMADIAARIAAEHNISISDLRGPSRLRQLAHPRQQAYAEMHATGRYSTTQIGQYFGGRDHSTVIHGIREHLKRSKLAEAA